MDFRKVKQKTQFKILETQFFLIICLFCEEGEQKTDLNFLLSFLDNSQ